MKRETLKQPDPVQSHIKGSPCPAQPAESPDQVVRPIKFHKILVPLDFSDCSKKAFQYAIPFARQLDAGLVLLHVLPATNAPSWKYDSIDQRWLLDESLQHDIEHQLSELVRGNIPPELPVETFIRYGSPEITIVNVAKEWDVDLIVMSTHGRTGLTRVLIGSVTSGVTRCAPCPVLVVREHEHEFILRELNPLGPDQISDDHIASSPVT